MCVQGFTMVPPVVEALVQPEWRRVLQFSREAFKDVRDGTLRYMYLLHRDSAANRDYIVLYLHHPIRDSSALQFTQRSSLPPSLPPLPPCGRKPCRFCAPPQISNVDRSDREVHQWFGGDTYGLSATYQGVGDEKFEMVAAVYQDRDKYVW